MTGFGTRLPAGTFRVWRGRGHIRPGRGGTGGEGSERRRQAKSRRFTRVALLHECKAAIARGAANEAALLTLPSKRATVFA